MHRHRHRLAAMPVLMAALLVTGAGPAAAQSRVATDTSTAAPSTIDRATVDLRALEKDVAATINEIRTDPPGLKARLTAIKEQSTPKTDAPDSPFGAMVRITLPVNDTFPVYASFLDSAIAQAGSTAAAPALVWSEGLHTTALNYANINPIGHTADGTTVETRADRNGYAVSTTGVGEGISYNGPTGASQALNLYIDSGVPGVGHRMAIINPDYTHVGVGCFYKNSSDDITCVVNYAVNWVEKADSAKLEYGHTYALRDDKNPQAFTYVSLESIGRDGGAVMARCPDGAGRYPLPATLNGLVTSVDTALAGNLTATNKPCSLPPGTLVNGTTLRRPPSAEA